MTNEPASDTLDSLILYVILTNSNTKTLCLIGGIATSQDSSKFSFHILFILKTDEITAQNDCFIK